MKANPVTVVLSLIFLLGTSKSPAGPLNQWIWRYPNPQGMTLRAVTYGGGQFVAVGDNGTIITSLDGFNWTVQSYDVFTNLQGVAYAAGEYAAVGDGGAILVSSNAETWAQIPSVTRYSLHGIAGDTTWQADDDPQFLAIGDSGTTVDCLRGTNWSVFPSGISNSLYGVSFDPSWTDYVVVGAGGTVDIFAFYQVPQDTLGTSNNLYAIATPGNGIDAVAGDIGGLSLNFNGILYSLDYGYDEWQIQKLNSLWFPSQTFILRSVTFGPNGFVAVGDTGYTLEFDYPGVVFTSSSGTNWTETSPYTSENRLYGAAYGNGVYVLVGDAGGIVVSSNLVNWTEIDGYHRSVITAIACSTNLCIASAAQIFREYSSFPDFSTIISSNGVDWSVSTTNLPALTDLTSGGNQFVGVNGTSLYTTTDGYNWQSNSSFTNTFRGVRYASNQFIAVGDSGSIFTSADGTNWNNDSVATSGSLYGVAYGNGLYVAAGSVAATSSDGISWLLGPSNPPAVIDRIVYGQGLFVASANGEILISYDGLNWQTQTTAPGGIASIAYSGGTFLAISGPGPVFESSDGTNWLSTGFSLPRVDGGSFGIYYSLNFPPFPAAYPTVCANQGTFFAAGLDGILVQSGNTWNPSTLTASQLSSNGFAFSYNQQVDVPYRIQSSTNLLYWANVYSSVGSGEPTNFVYTVSSNNVAQFFRIASP